MYRNKFTQNILMKNIPMVVARFALNPRRGWKTASDLSLVVVVSLLATLTLAGRAAAQEPCPNTRSFGARMMAARRGGETRRVLVQALYFRTEDESAFIPEVAGSRWNSGTKLLRTDDFGGTLGLLVASGEAEVNSRHTGSIFLGDTAELDRAPNSLNWNVSFGDTAHAGPRVSRLRALDRYTTFSVYRNEGEPFYHLDLLSWFVEAKPDGDVRMRVDLDAGALLRPGETVVYKLMSDFEVARHGSGRTYLSLSLAPLGDGGQRERAAAVRKSDRAAR